MMAIKVAGGLGLKLVLNLPGSLEVCDFFGMPSLSNSVSLFGVTFLYSGFKAMLMKAIMGGPQGGLNYFPKSLILANTFFGIDDARTLPPNIKMVGPLSKRDGEESGGKSRPLEKDLEEWLEKMAILKKPVVYVTFGSML